MAVAVHFFKLQSYNPTFTSQVGWLLNKKSNFEYEVKNLILKDFIL